MRATNPPSTREANTVPASPIIPLLCHDCGHIFLPLPGDESMHCTQCGSGRCDFMRRQVGGKLLSGGRPVEEDRFARMAMWGHLITSAQFAECVEEQKQRAGEGRDVPSLPHLFIEKGYIRSDQADAILKVMTSRSADQWRNQFGQVALRKEFITEEQLRECLEFQTKLVMSTGAAPFLGHILIEHGYMAEAQVLAILRAQEQRHIGVLHDLEAELLPARARVAQLLRRHPYIVWGVLAALGIVVAATVGAIGHAVASAPTTYELICDRCGHYGRATAGSLTRPCPHCGKGQMCTVLWCAKCGIEFPLKVRTVAGRTPWLEGCPKCGTLDHVRLPPSIEKLPVRPPLMKGRAPAHARR